MVAEEAAVLLSAVREGIRWSAAASLKQGHVSRRTVRSRWPAGPVRVCSEEFYNLLPRTHGNAEQDQIAFLQIRNSLESNLLCGEHVSEGAQAVGGEEAPRSSLVVGGI